MEISSDFSPANINCRFPADIASPTPDTAPLFFSADNPTAVENTASHAGDSHDSESIADQFHPYWIPEGVEIDDWSPALRAEVARLINPLYRELVLESKSALQRSAGLTAVSLSWLEILDQLRIAHRKEATSLLDSAEALLAEPRASMIDRHLRLVGAKLRFSQFLVRLQELKERGRERRARSAPSKPRQSTRPTPKRDRW